MKKIISLVVSFPILLTLFFNNALGETSAELKEKKEQEDKELIIKFANRDILLNTRIKGQRYNHFQCAGIGMVDKGIALDGGAIFYSVDTLEFICEIGMGYCVSAHDKSCNGKCPPSDWVESNCWGKRKELLYK